MSSEPGGRHESLPTALVRAYVLSHVRMRAFNMLLEVLLFYVVLVAAGVGAFEGALVIVGAEVGGKTGGTIEPFFAARMRAFDRLEIGRPFSSRAERRERGAGGICGFGILRFTVRVVVIVVIVVVDVAVLLEVQFKGKAS
jgi:hypothetical protein